MTDERNRRLGAPVPGWVPPPEPAFQELQGQYVRLERVSAERHAEDLWKVFQAHDAVWDYMPYGPFGGFEDYAAWLAEIEGGQDPVFFAIKSLASDHWEGVASYLRITPAAGSIEVGHINFSPALQGTRAATEAMFLMMQWAFDAGYRRYEWKCDALNQPSRRAAQRFGFSYEGIFRQATVVKGRNRDTAWFAIIDQEWPALRDSFAAWLAPDNFNGGGRQKQSLSALTRPLLVARDPSL